MSIEVEGYADAVKRVAGMDARIRKAAAKEIQTTAGQTVSLMRSKASNANMRAAAATVRLERPADGATIRGGGIPVFAGAEFGGRKRRRTYAMRRRGTSFIMHRRRTTMQFLTHLGKRGYFFWPSIREKFTGIARRTSIAIEAEVNR